MPCKTCKKIMKVFTKNKNTPTNNNSNYIEDDELFGYKPDIPMSPQCPPTPNTYFSIKTNQDVWNIYGMLKDAEDLGLKVKRDDRSIYEISKDRFELIEFSIP